jgi:hypothetical protein
LSAPSRLIEGFSLANHRFKPVCNKSAYRAPLLGCQNARFSQQIGIKLEGDVRFHDPKIAQLSVLHEL